MRTAPHVLMYLNVWTLVSDQLEKDWERCGLVGEVWPCGKRCVTWGGLWGSSSACQSVSSQLLLQHHACLLPCPCHVMLMDWLWNCKPPINRFFYDLPLPWYLFAAIEKWLRHLPNSKCHHIGSAYEFGGDTNLQFTTEGHCNNLGERWLRTGYSRGYKRWKYF